MLNIYAQKVIDTFKAEQEKLAQKRNELRSSVGNGQYVVKVGDLYLRRDDSGDLDAEDSLTGLARATTFTKSSAEGWANQIGNLAGDRGEAVPLVVALGDEYAKLSNLINEIELAQSGITNRGLRAPKEDRHD